MKRSIAIILLAALLASFAACSGKNTPARDPEGYIALLDNAIRLPKEHSDELIRKVYYPGETEYYVNYYRDNKGEDYMAILNEEFGNIAAHYAETYGEDWKLSYKINEADVKDAEGIEKYKSFDSFYFKTYGIDTDKITDVVFAKVTVTIEGSKDSNSKDKTVQCFCVDGEWYSFYAIRLGVGL